MKEYKVKILDPQSRYRTVLRYHPHAKQLRTRNKHV